MSKLVGNHVVDESARASQDRTLKRHESAPSSRLRTGDQKPCSFRPPRVVDPYCEPRIPHQLFLHAFRQGREDINDTFLQRFIGDKGRNEVVDRVHTSPADPHRILSGLAHLPRTNELPYGGLTLASWRRARGFHLRPDGTRRDTRPRDWGEVPGRGAFVAQDLPRRARAL